MRTGRLKRSLMLEATDQDKLELLAGQPKIVLRATERLSNQEITRRLGVTGATVGKWRERYSVQRMRFKEVRSEVAFSFFVTSFFFLS